MSVDVQCYFFSPIPYQCSTDFYFFLSSPSLNLIPFLSKQVKWGTRNIYLLPTLGHFYLNLDLVAVYNLLPTTYLARSHLDSLLVAFTYLFIYLSLRVSQRYLYRNIRGKLEAKTVQPQALIHARVPKKPNCIIENILETKGKRTKPTN